MTIARPAPRRDLIEKAAESAILDFRRQSWEHNLRQDLLISRLGCQLSQVSLGRDVRGVVVWQFAKNFCMSRLFPSNSNLGAGRKMVLKDGFSPTRIRVLLQQCSIKGSIISRAIQSNAIS